MNSINNDNNNKKTFSVKGNFVKLKADLKNIVFSFLPIEESFNSIFSCNKSFIKALKKTKVFNLIVDNKELKKMLKEKYCYSEYLRKILFKWQSYFETREVAYNFIIRILNKVYSGIEVFEYDKKIVNKFDGIYLKFISQSKSLKQIIFKNLNYATKEEEAERPKAIAEALISNTSIQSIDISSNKLGDEGAKAIAEALKLNTSIQLIWFSFNKIGDKGAKSIGEALKINSSIQEVSIDHNDLSDEGAKAIAEALKPNTSIRTIELSSNKIGDEGAKAIREALKFNKTLEGIWLSSNKIGDEGAKAIGEALVINTSIQSISLSYNEISEEVRKYLNDNFETKIEIY